MSKSFRHRCDFPKDLVLFVGTVPLHEANDPHVRNCEIRLPARLTDVVVNATTYGEGPHTPFPIFSIKKNILGDETQIAIEAQGPVGGAPKTRYYCDFSVYGKIKSR